MAYRLKPGDEVELRFLDVEQLDDRVVVRPDGRMSLQLVGDIDAAGQTLPQLQDTVTAKYLGILKNTQVTATLRTLAPQRVYVDGEVQNPGLIQATEPITAKAAVAGAGGMKTSAARTDVLLIRRASVGARPQISVLDLASVEDGTDTSKDVQLTTNDIIFVPRSTIGNVNRFVDLYLRQNVPVPFSFQLPGSTHNAAVLTNLGASGAATTTTAAPPPAAAARAPAP